MRMDQFPGLPPIALKFLEETQLPPAICETCGHVIGPPYRKQVGTYGGGFGGKFPLFRYPLWSGETADEFLQTVSWSSGPVHFLGLQLLSGLEFIWSEAEINEWL